MFRLPRIAQNLVHGERQPSSRFPFANENHENYFEIAKSILVRSWSACPILTTWTFVTVILRYFISCLFNFKLAAHNERKYARLAWPNTLNLKTQSVKRLDHVQLPAEVRPTNKHKITLRNRARKQLYPESTLYDLRYVHPQNNMFSCYFWFLLLNQRS